MIQCCFMRPEIFRQRINKNKKKLMTKISRIATTCILIRLALFNDLEFFLVLKYAGEEFNNT